jgi:hypothetical protein
VDGPQSVLLERTADSKIIGVAIGLPGHEYPFFGSAISIDQWERYKRGFVDIRFLFMFPRWKEWFIFDLATSKNGEIPLVPAENDEFVQVNYVPDHHFFAYDHSQPIEREDRSSLATQKYSTDGIWDLPDFSHFYNKVTDLYSFFLSLKKYSISSTANDLKRKINEAFSGQPMKGGLSYVNLYEALSFVQGLEDRLSVGKLRYASPGEVDVKGRLDIFDEMAVTLNEYQSNFEVIKEKSKEMHGFMKKWALKG